MRRVWRNNPRRWTAAPSLVEAVRTREAEIARLRAELDDPDPANAAESARNRMSSHLGNLRLTLPRSESVASIEVDHRSDEMAQGLAAPGSAPRKLRPTW